MNRIASYLPQAKQSDRVTRVIRSMRRLEEETEAKLEEMAYVLNLTRRIKAEIMREQNPTPGMSA